MRSGMSMRRLRLRPLDASAFSNPEPQARQTSTTPLSLYSGTAGCLIFLSSFTMPSLPAPTHRFKTARREERSPLPFSGFLLLVQISLRHVGLRSQTRERARVTPQAGPVVASRTELGDLSCRCLVSTARDGNIPVKRKGKSVSQMP